MPGIDGRVHPLPVVRAVTRAELRTRWRALTVLALLATLWAGVTTTAVAGARRTGSVVDRFLRVTRASDAQYLSDAASVEPLGRSLLARPEVEAADVLWSAGTGLAYDRGIFVNLVVGVTGSWGREFARPILVEGRLADPAVATEVTVTRSAADLLGVGPGDPLSITTWDKAVWDAWQVERGAYPPFDGPRVEVTVVGVVRLASDLEASQETGLVVVATPAFYSTWGASIGDNGARVAVRFRDREVDPGALLDPLTAELLERIEVETADDAYVTALRDATGTMSTALWAVALAAGLAGGLVVGWSFAREARRTAVRHQALLAIGATRLQRAAAVSAPFALCAAVAAVASGVVGVLTSAWFPIGPGRRAEPAPGTHADLLVLAANLLLVVLAAGLAAHVSTRTTHRPAVPARGGHLGRVANRTNPAVRVGWATAVGKERRSSIVAVVATIAGLTAITWFGSSVRGLVDHPDRWGYTWSSSPELGFASSQWEQKLDEASGVPGVAVLGTIRASVVRIDGAPVTVTTLTRGRLGRAEPRLLSGEPADGLDEIALGESTARGLGVGIGDLVQVAPGVGAGSIREFRVAGLVVVPKRLENDDPGRGAFLSERAYLALRFPPETEFTTTTFLYTDDADPAAVEEALRSQGWVFGARSHARVDGALANLDDTMVLLPWLAGFFVLLGVGAVVLTATRRGTRHTKDLAILRALGFSRRDIARVARTTAATAALAGLVVGVPIGLLIGRTVWRRSTGDLGVVDDQASLAPAVAVAFAAILLVGTVGALLDGRRARVPTANELRVG